MYRLAVADPGTSRRPRRGQTAGGDGHHLVDLVGGRRAQRGDADAPPAVGRATGHRHVSSQVDQHATIEIIGDPGGVAVSGQGLAGGPDVDPDLGRNDRGAGHRVQDDPPPARGGTGSGLRHRLALVDLIEVPVITQCRHRRCHRGVHRSGRLDGDHARHLEHVEEQPAHSGRSSVPEALQTPELRVGAKTAAGLVQGSQAFGQQRQRPVGPIRGGHNHAGRRADGPHRAHGQRRRIVGQRAVAETDRGVAHV